MVNLPQEDLDAIEASKAASAARDEFLDAIGGGTDQPVQRDDRGELLLTKYGIPADQWKMWATAAGLPNATWDDHTAASQVAGWAVTYLAEQFDNNWGLIAIGWRYGAGTARQIRDAYGGTPAGSILESILGKGGAALVDTIINSVRLGPPPPSQRGYPGVTAQAGAEVNLSFTPEEGELFRPEQKRRGANPAHTALLGVLSAMADKNSVGGKRLAIEDIEIAEVPGGDELDTGVEAVTMTEVQP